MRKAYPSELFLDIFGCDFLLPNGKRKLVERLTEPLDDNEDIEGAGDVGSAGNRALQNKTKNTKTQSVC